MARLSIGGSLVLRQLLFMILLVLLGIAAYVGALQIRDLAHSLATAEPAQMVTYATELAAAADSLANSLLIGPLVGCFMVVAVSMPVMQRTLAKPIEVLASQMTDLAAGKTDIQIVGADRRDEIGRIAQALVI